jgi:ammonia channel protein AmtB
MAFYKDWNGCGTDLLLSWGLAIVGTLIALKATDFLVGVRVSGEPEVQGLDLSQRGEVGYDFES